jgi:hypothetical protein
MTRQFGNNEETHRSPRRRTFRRAMLLAAGVSLLCAGVTFGADTRPATGSAGVVEPLLELLVQKKLIRQEDADALTKKVGKGTEGDDFLAIVDLLQERGVIQSPEADGLRQRRHKTLAAEAVKGPESPAAAGVAPKHLALPEEDVVIVDQLRRQWLAAGYQADGFPEILGEPADIGLAITKMRAMGVLSPEEATRLDAGYHQNHLTGVMQTAMDQREQAVMGQVQKTVQAEVRKEVQTEIKKEVKEAADQQAKASALPEWLKRFTLSGDIRLRYQGDFFTENNYIPINPATGAYLYNTTADRNRFLMRARLMLNVKIADQVEAGLRLATGNLDNPVTNNQTMGNYEKKYSTIMDLAYLKWSPSEQLTLWGGRIPNLFFCTDLVWSPNLTFDAIAVEARAPFSSTLGGFLTAGVFPLQEFEYTTKDKWLFAGQAGVQYQPGKDVNVKLGVAYYYFNNVQGEYSNPNSPLLNSSVPGYVQKGNTYFDVDPTTGYLLALASNYHELNITASVDVGLWERLHLVFIGDFVRNLGFNVTQARLRTGDPFLEKNVNGYQVGAVFGHPQLESFLDWRAFLFYKYLGADAVIDAFTDSDFNLGGTNAKGWIVGGDLGLTKNFWLRMRWLTSNEISGPPFGVNVLQFDLNGKF